VLKLKSFGIGCCCCA